MNDEPFPHASKYHSYFNYFKIKNSPILDDLYFILVKGRHTGIEPSIKVEQNQLFPSRFNIYFKPPSFHFAYESLLMLINSVRSYSGLELSTSKLLALFDSGLVLNMEYKTVIIGLDLRDDFITSRLKFWMVVKDKSILRKKLKGVCGAVQDFFFDDVSIIGIDFKFDGSSKFKVYCSYSRLTEEISNFLGVTSLVKDFLRGSQAFYLEILSSPVAIQARSYPSVINSLVKHPIIKELSPTDKYIVGFSSDEQQPITDNFNLYFKDKFIK